MRSKLWTITCLAVAVAMMLGACATPTQAPVAAPTQAPAAAPTQAPAAAQPTAAPAAAATAAPSMANCTDATRVPITWSTIAGFYTDAMTAIINDFQAEHCAKVTVVGIDNSQLYDKQIIEAVGNTGAYDVYTIETAEKAGFAENGYILPLDDYIKSHDTSYMDIAPILRDVTTVYKGHIWGMPYYTYTEGQFFRQDLFDDPTEQAAFKAAYNYPLAPPQTWQQLSDMAKFFDRKVGDKLKGVVLTKPFYGIGLMAGNFQEIQDELFGMILWKEGQTPNNQLLADDGTITVNDAASQWALDFYVNDLLPYADPNSVNVTYDGVMNMMDDCDIAMTGNFFLDQFPNAVKVEKNCPGAKLGVGEGIEKKVYMGAFLMGVSSASKNPQVAMDFVAFVAGKKAQTKFASMGGATTLMSVLTDPQFNTPATWTATGHYPTLVKVFNNMQGLESNLFFSPFGAKLYNAEGPIEHKAAVKQETPKQTLDELYNSWVQICGGPKCTVNKGAAAPAAAQPTAAPAVAAAPTEDMSKCTDATRVPITWSTIAGFYTDAMTAIINDFQAEHCAKVTVVGIDNSQLYDKQIIEAVGNTGAYDVYTIETAEKAGFAENGYILPLDDYIKSHDTSYMDIAPILRDVTTVYKGHIWGMPYYTYTEGQFFRQDLFDDPTEQAAFKAAYNYPLAPPQTWQQLSDMAKFFDRKVGDKLKGVVLTKPFYGIGLMAGNFQEIQDELFGMILWKEGQTPNNQLLADDGTITVNDAASQWALDFYVNDLLPYADPNSVNVTYDGVMNMMDDCDIAMTGNFFLDQFPNAVKVEKNCPGAKLGVGEGIEKKVYMGAFLMGVSSASKNPQVAMDFVAFVAGKKAQTKFASMGGATTLMSVLTDPQFNTPATWTATGHYPTLVKVFNNMQGLESNLFFSPFGAKLYNAEGPIEHKAAVKQETPKQTLDELYNSWVQICGGPKCTVNK